MKQLFENRERPLYASAVPLRLGRLEDGDIADYVAGRFAETSRSVVEALNPLLDTAQGHPQRAIMLAHHLWEQVQPEKAATLGDWERAHDAVLAQLEPEFDAMWRGYGSTVSQKTLRSIVAGGGFAYRQAILSRLDLEKKAAANAAVRWLLDRADIEEAGSGEYRIVDPLYAQQIARINAGSEASFEDD